MFEKYLTLKNFPLYYGPLNETILKTLPNRIDLDIGIDTQYDIVRLRTDEKLLSLLDKTYQLGSNPSVPLGKGKIQTRVMNSILQQLECFSNGKENYKVVEVGCGEGHLLNNLGKLGWTVKGYEISPTAVQAKEEFNIDIVQDYFTYKDGLKYDLIFSYNVLEHIIDLDEFIMQGYKSLETNGVFCHIVPDCENMLKQGNLRVISHQHVNYFTAESLVNLFKQYNFQDVNYKIITPGNSLMVYGYKRTSEEIKKVVSSLISTDLVQTFSNRLFKSLNKLEVFLDDALIQNKKIAFYSGGMPEYLILNRKEDILFVNGDPMMHNKRIFSELDRIKSPQELTTFNTDIIIIFASNYFMEIKKYICTELKIAQDTKIISIDEIIA